MEGQLTAHLHFGSSHVKINILKYFLTYEDIFDLFYLLSLF